MSGCSSFALSMADRCTDREKETCEKEEQKHKKVRKDTHTSVTATVTSAKRRKNRNKNRNKIKDTVKVSHVKNKHCTDYYRHVMAMKGTNKMR